MKHGAIFDMDGTLLDTERLYQNTWVELAKEFGQTPEPAFPRAVCGSSGEHMLEIIRTYYPDVDAQQFMDSCYARVAQAVETSIPKKPGMEEILSYLRGHGVKLAVASSNAHTQIEKNLRLAGVLDYFDAVVGGDEVENSKPAPDIFLLAAKRLGAQIEDCVVFEDVPHAVATAKDAGFYVVGVYDSITVNDGNIRPYVDDYVEDWRTFKIKV